MEQITEPTTELSLEIDAAPADVWRIVADVTRIPEWSPVCHRVEWVAPSAAAEPVRLWLFGADAPLDLVKGCYRVTGKARLPPPWALGPFIWRDEGDFGEQRPQAGRHLRRADRRTRRPQRLGHVHRLQRLAVHFFDPKPEPPILHPIPAT